MNKNDLIDTIASGSGLSKADSGRALEAFIGAVTSSLRGGGNVKIQVLALSLLVTEQQQPVEILGLVNLFKFQLLRMLNLNLEKV